MCACTPLVWREPNCNKYCRKQADTNNYSKVYQMIVDKPMRTTCFITMGEYQLAQQLERGPTWYPPPSFLPPERDCRTGSIIQTEKASTLLNNQNFVTFIKSSTTMSSAGIVLMNQTEAYIPEDYFEAIAQFLDYTCIFWEPWLGQLTRYIWNSKKPGSWC